FFEGDRITAMREMIVAPDEAGRRRALAKLLPMQREDFEGIFEAMAGLPVTIRLLDPPLHEFLPHGKDELGTLARAMKLPAVRLGAPGGGGRGGRRGPAGRPAAAGAPPRGGAAAPPRRPAGGGAGGGGGGAAGAAGGGVAGAGGWRVPLALTAWFVAAM